MARPRVRTPELRSQFVAVGVDLVSTHGVDQLTTRRVASEAGSSLAALDELFGGKGGLVDAVALEGFALLASRVASSSVSEAPRQRLVDVCHAIRAFVLDRSRLAELMFSRPFASFGPAEADRHAAAEVRRAVERPLRELVGVERSDDQVADLAVGLVSLVQGLAWQELGGVLASGGAAADRRFAVAVETYLAGAVGPEGG